MISPIDPAQCQLHSEKLDTLLSEVRTVRELLTGNGDPSKGLVVRVDRMERFIAGVKAIAAWVLAPALGLIVAGAGAAVVWIIVTMHKGGTP